MITRPFPQLLIRFYRFVASLCFALSAPSALWVLNRKHHRFCSLFLFEKDEFRQERNQIDNDDDDEVKKITRTRTHFGDRYWSDWLKVWSHVWLHSLLDACCKWPIMLFISRSLFHLGGQSDMSWINIEQWGTFGSQSSSYVTYSSNIS